jgi:4-hydroxy-tetrahydrodipicolinate synthase
MEFKGTYVAMLTPFTGDNRINEDKLREMVDFQIKNGTTGLVPCGTTGESPTLSWDEHKRVVKITVEAAKGRAQVIAGAGSNNTAEAIEAACYAREVGADAVLIVNPYYNKPTQEGLYRHFKTIAEKAGLPVVVYNIQSRTGVNISTETMVRLKAVSHIAAVKEASGSINQISDVILRCGDKLDVLSGDDSLTLPLLAVGGKGIISVIANIIPGELKQMCDSFFKGDFKSALAMHQKMLPLCQAMFVETNPIPLREAMNRLGWEVGESRLPLTPIGDKSRQVLMQAMKNFGLKLKG